MYSSNAGSGGFGSSSRRNTCSPLDAFLPPLHGCTCGAGGAWSDVDAAAAGVASAAAAAGATPVFLTGSCDRDIKVHAQRETLAWLRDPHASTVGVGVFLPNGALLTSGMDGSAHVWDVTPISPPSSHRSSNNNDDNNNNNNNSSSSSKKTSVDVSSPLSSGWRLRRILTLPEASILAALVMSDGVLVAGTAENALAFYK
jgi:hypothetical protein